MKSLTESQVDDLIKIKFGQLVTAPGHTAYVSNKVLAKIFQISEHSISNIIRARYERHRRKNMSLLQQLKPPEKGLIPHQRFRGRQRFGFRFLKPHQVDWIVNEEILKLQTGMSLKDRVKHFKKQFPDASMNYTLLAKVYRMHNIKKKKIKWLKVVKDQTEQQHN